MPTMFGCARPGGRLRLAPEALAELRVLGEPRSRAAFECHAAAEHLVLGAPDLGHAAAPQASEHPVAAVDDECRARSCIYCPSACRTRLAIGAATLPPGRRPPSTTTAMAICGSGSGP